MTLDLSAIRQIFSLESAAAIIAACALLLTVRMWNGIPKFFEQWIAYKRAKADEKAADWTRLREENKRLDERCRRLETAEEKCRNDLAEVQTRLSTLEGYHIGTGTARQEASILSAAKRITDENGGPR